MDASTEQLFSRLCSNDPSLTSYHLSSDSISDSEATALAVVLHRNSSLTNLALSHNFLVPSVASVLVAALQYNSSHNF